MTHPERTATPPPEGVGFARELPPQVHDHKTFRPDIEGLRAVAVIAVVLFHASVPGWSGGYVGVDVFFVISGFLITGLLWREVSTNGTLRLRAFYGARARRLLPASAAVGVTTMVAATLLLPPLQVTSVLHDGILSALYVSNYRFMQDGVDYFGADSHLSPSPFLHYWSLGVEEQFYLVWAPLLLGVTCVVRLVSGRRPRFPGESARARLLPYIVALAFVSVASFAMSLALTSISPTVAFYSLPTRAWQLALGGLVALTIGRWRRLPGAAAGVAGWGGLALILLACTLFRPTTPFPGTAALLPTLGAVLVIGAGCATPSENCGRLLGLSPMRAIGRISYSWYLWHWPVLVFAPLVMGHSLGLAERIAAALAAAGLAWLTLRYIENPLRFAPALRRSPGRSLAVGGTATVIAVATGVTLAVTLPPPVGRGDPVTPLSIVTTHLPQGSGTEAYEAAVVDAFAQVQAGVEVSARRGAVPSNLDPPLTRVKEEETAVYLDGCMRHFFDTGHPECASGDISSNTTIALVGDSHAAMWHPAFQRVAGERRFRLETIARAGCPFLDLPVEIPGLRRQYTECHQWREEIIARLSNNPPELVVLSIWRGYGLSEPASLTSYDSAWSQSLTQVVRELRDLGSQVLVLGPIPDPQTMIPICVSDHLDDPTSCSPHRQAAVNMSGIAVEIAATTDGGARYVDVTDLFCTPERCPAIVGNTLVYFDRNHMTLEYSRVLAPVMGAVIDLELARSELS